MLVYLLVLNFVIMTSLLLFFPFFIFFYFSSIFIEICQRWEVLMKSMEYQLLVLDLALHHSSGIGEWQLWQICYQLYVTWTFDFMIVTRRLWSKNRFYNSQVKWVKDWSCDYRLQPLLQSFSMCLVLFQYCSHCIISNTVGVIARQKQSSAIGKIIWSTSSGSRCICRRESLNAGRARSCSLAVGCCLIFISYWDLKMSLLDWRSFDPWMEVGFFVSLI